MKYVIYRVQISYWFAAAVLALAILFFAGVVRADGKHHPEWGAENCLDEFGTWRLGCLTRPRNVETFFWVNRQALELMNHPDPLVQEVVSAMWAYKHCSDWKATHYEHDTQRCQRLYRRAALKGKVGFRGNGRLRKCRTPAPASAKVCLP